MIFKYSFYLIALVAAIYLASYVFNHIDAWSGIGLAVLIAVFTINFIYQKIKKQTEK